MSFVLRGLPEGIVGHSNVQANSFEELLNKYPQLANVKEKISVAGNVVSGFASCDG
ncbi:hypothetical protein J4772_27100 [Cohnella sp. LGH]|uniref:hypothetical protein n=1 Tax=Cohnella sp. LGH TaxID=1619153 RepID=UPI001ADA6619|nr:hypothetical protein [Cohnella sp. LGH]QTH41191.1 hypothetical protein J4772_27100 [Cohnella sp. LGH]